MLKKSLSRTQAFSKFKLLFSKTNVFSFKSFFQKAFFYFSKLNQVFLSFFVITFIMVAKIGVTPIFATVDCKDFPTSNTNIYYVGDSDSNTNCPSGTIRGTISAFLVGLTCDNSTQIEVCHSLPSAFNARTCCRNKSFAEACLFSGYAPMLVAADSCDSNKVITISNIANNTGKVCCETDSQDQTLVNLNVTCVELGGTLYSYENDNKPVYDTNGLAFDYEKQEIISLSGGWNAAVGSEYFCAKDKVLLSSCEKDCLSKKITDTDSFYVRDNSCDNTNDIITSVTSCSNAQKVCCQRYTEVEDNTYASAVETCRSLGGIISTSCTTDAYSYQASVTDDETAAMVTNLSPSVCCLSSSNQNPDIGNLSLNINTNNLKLQSLLDMNPLQNSSVFSDPDSRTPGNIINQALTAVVFPIAGVGLIILILWGGFQVLSGSLSGKQNNIDLGKKRVTAAVVGFILLFLIYWIWRLIALATGLSV